ncbi:MAG: SDR family NAD(P)-dependent oxidoreductase [Lachnospiraceae bacterium]|nr:SDR family NAD(P)-dependent oxidoreductase [Lachnospiraceae bacterium]
MKKKNIAIITGASSGFGKEFVKLLSQDPSIDELWAIARNQENLDALSKEYKKIKTFSLDLSHAENIKKLENILKSDNPKISYLINNAGYGKFGNYAVLNIDESLNMMHLNMDAVVAMGLICIPFMGKGSHILNIASQASFQPLPYMNIYGSTKAFVRFYSRALHVELKGKGISVTAVCPGWMHTSFFSRAKTTTKKTITNYVGIIPPKKVAKKALMDAKKGKALSIYGAFPHFTHVMAKLLPQNILMKVWLRQQKLF